MEFRSYRLCVALLLLLCACYYVSSQPADPASQPTDDANKMMDMIYRQLRDTGSMMTDIKTLIMLQMQHSRDVTKANNDLQSQYNSAMAGMTETLAAINSQINYLNQQQNETQAAMNSQINSLNQQQNETRAAMNSQINYLNQQQNEAQAAMNSQINSLNQQQKETRAAMNSQINSLAQRQSETQNTLAGMNQFNCLLQKQNTAVEGCAGNINGPTTMCVDSHAFTAPCDGQGWIVIQRRVNNDYFLNRDWEDYKHGFGDLAGSFWLGLEDMHRLTTNYQAILRVELEDWEGNSTWAQYASFRLEGESGNYKLHLGAYSGTAGNSLGYYDDGAMFSTLDKDNDVLSGNCAAEHGGAGWWYHSCAQSCLNGVYVPGGAGSYRHGIYWRHWKGYYYSYKKAQMKLFITL